MLARIPIPSKAEAQREIALALLLEGVVRLNCYLIKRHNLPSIYDSGVRYKRDGSEDWLNVLEIIKRGYDDCEGLASARAAEWRVNRGVPAAVIVVRTGPKTLHAMVSLPDGTIEDPSRVLGMGKRG
jgi:hypothetical protein